MASVETFIYKNRASAMDAERAARIRNSAALFIAGGDSWNDVNFWRGTPVVEAIQELTAKGRPIGGTSAGLAVLGQFAFGARNGSVRSAEALADPCCAGVALERDRMRRLLVFLARISVPRRSPAHARRPRGMPRAAGGRFDIKTWSSDSGTRYALDVKAGVVSSSQDGGGVY